MHIGWRSFAVKLALSYAILVLVAGAGMGVLGQRYLSQIPERKAADNVSTLASVLGTLVSANPSVMWSDRFDAQVKEMARESKMGLSVFRIDGKMVSASGIEPAEGWSNNWRDAPEFITARERGSSFVHSEGIGGAPGSQIAVRPIVAANDIIGFVRAEFPLEQLAMERRNLVVQFSAVAVGGLSVALVMGALFSNAILSPLRAVVDRCRSISAGDWDDTLRVSSKRKDEFGLLARTMESMAAVLRFQQDDAERRRSQLEHLLGLLNDAVLVLNYAGELTFANPEAGNYFTEEHGSVIGTDIGALSRVENLGIVIREVLEKESYQAREISWKEESGDERFARIYFASLKEDADPDAALLVVIHEITDQRRFEILRRDFASNVSHELKTPITAIGALLDAIIDADDEMDERTRRNFLRRLENQNDRMLRLVNELLALSKLESGTGILDFKSLGISTVLQSAEETFRPVAETREINLYIEDKSDQETFWGDPVAVEVMINSLVDNALKYTPKLGSVRLSVEKPNEHEVLFTFADTGPGIPRAHRTRIFERFYRVEAARSRPQGGSGLGLAIVKHLATAHAGKIWLESVEGRGSTFYLSLPIAPYHS